MKKTISLLLFLLFALNCIVDAQSISRQAAAAAAQNWVGYHDGFTIGHSDILTNIQGEILAYHYDLLPVGYLVLTADQNLPPVIAYSMNSAFSARERSGNPLLEMLIIDIGSRMEHLDLISDDIKEINRSRWTALLENEPDIRTFEQWPPAGSTGTGGWLETNWKQSSPYNKFCPMDNVNSARSVAGCPAVALAMIIHYQKNLNGTQFSDNDDYYHSYAGRQYWIDDDALGWDFPDFPAINGHFDAIELKFQDYEPLSEDEIAALVFGCGVAAKQVYTSQVSGTFGVDQAYDAYLRFGYTGASLVYDSDTTFYRQMKNNIKDSRPVHLAVLSNTGQGGHNVVADGYNTDDYYHLNFGWGGSYNGWYLLPDEIPYNLTIIEGAVLDIGIAHVGIDGHAGSNNLNVDIFPNPVNNKLHVTFQDPSNYGGRCEIISPDGKKLLDHPIPACQENFELDLGNLQSGMYFCIIRTGNMSSTQKIIKK